MRVVKTPGAAGPGSPEPSGSPESLSRLLGGWQASTDATLPPVGFVVGWLVSGRSVGWGAAVALVIGVLLAGYRMLRGTRPRAVLLGLLGVAVASVIAVRTGRAADFFVVQLATNAASVLVWLVSIVIRWPLLGVVVGTALRQGGRWRRDPELLRAYGLASWVWVGQYVVRVTVFAVLYAANATVALGVARVALTWPLVAACVAVSAVVLRKALPSGHPGIRHPRVPDDHDPDGADGADGAADADTNGGAELDSGSSARDSKAPDSASDKTTDTSSDRRSDSVGRTESRNVRSRPDLG